MRNLVALACSFSLLVLGATASHAQITTPNKVELVAKDLRVVWSMVFTSKDRMIFTERPGRVRVMEKGVLRNEPLFTIPDVDATGKLGAMGMVLHPNYRKNHWVYLAYSYRIEAGPRVRVVRYRDTGKAFVEPKTIIEDIVAWTNHAGCRLLFGPDGKLYLTTGDADKPDLAQQLNSLSGKVLRLNDDGTIPQDNPFARQTGARPEIWTYGHRNSQGIDFQPGTNLLFESEHGPTGGDEINIIERGRNYGWPLVHHEMYAYPMVSPILNYGLPSPAPGSTIFYRGNAFPELKNNLLVGCLRGECILRIQLDGRKVLRQERLLEHQYGRIREVTEAPDGSIYFSTSMFDPPEANGKDGYDQILRIVPTKK